MQTHWKKKLYDWKTSVHLANWNQYTHTHIRNAHDEYDDDDHLRNEIVHMSKSTQNVCS